MDREPIVFCVRGQPITQLRTRVRAFLDGEGVPRAQVYDPGVSRRYKERVAWEAKVAMKGQSPFTGPVRASVLCRFTPADSWPRWKIEAATAGRVKPTSIGDADNFAKAALDALKGIVWADDAQVVELNVVKEYHERPALWIKVSPLTGAPSSVKNLKEMEAITG